MDFHGQAAAHKITLRNAKHRLEWCRARCHWTLEQWNLGLVDARKTLPVRMHCANCKVWWRRKIVLGSLGKALSSFSMTISPCTKRGPYSNGLSRSVWKNLTGLHRALTSTPLNTFGMNWNADCEPGLITQHQCPTSLMLLWLNGSKSPQQCSNI